MDFLVGLHTDIGLKKPTNQDSLCIKEAITDQGKVLFAIICDGMGGLEKGEVASATLIHRLSYWFENELPLVINDDNRIEEIKYKWDRILKEENNNINDYGYDRNIRLGTTVTMILFLQDGSYIYGHIGDSRIYCITSNSLHQLTDDHTLVNLEVKRGRLTEEQAKRDPRRSVLLQCIGASNVINPDYETGRYNKEECYLLCSDGFRHEITHKEIYDYCSPVTVHNENDINKHLTELIEINKLRNERDNISALLVKII